LPSRFISLVTDDLDSRARVSCLSFEDEGVSMKLFSLRLYQGLFYQKQLVFTGTVNSVSKNHVASRAMNWIHSQQSQKIARSSRIISWNAPISNKEPFYVTERNYRYYLARYFQMKIEGLSNMITRRASLVRITQADALRFSLTCAGTCRRTLSCSWDEFSTQTTRMRVNWIETALDTGSFGETSPKQKCLKSWTESSLRWVSLGQWNFPINPFNISALVRYHSRISL